MKHKHIFLLFAACIISAAPLLGQQVGGDIMVHLTRLHCFAAQFWQGDLLPRWCFEADGGVGSPALLFYPPLPYLATSLLYPLHWLGVTVYGVYVAAVFCAVLLAAFGCFFWLKDVTGETAALLGAALYVFLPYHSEVLVGRSGYGELWVLAFAPFMALALRRGQMRRFAVWTALALLAEPAVVLCLLMGFAVVLLMQGKPARRTGAQALAACVAALLLSGFYWLPVLHYLPFVSIEQAQRAPVWANNFVQPDVDWRAGRGRFLMGLAITALGFFWLCQAFFRRSALKKETLAWAVAGGFSLLLLFPVSMPLWWVINHIAPIGFPWRMQAVLLLAVSYLSAVYAHSAISRRGYKTFGGDALALVTFLFCFEMVCTYVVAPEKMVDFKRLLQASSMAMPEFRTPWTAREEATNDASLRRYESADQSPAEIIGGDGAVRMWKWSWRSVSMEVNALHGRVTLRVYQRYFPLWHLKADQGVRLEPEQGTGYMLITVPEGHHTVRLVLESHWDTLLGRGAHREKELESQQLVPHDFVALHP